jgi:hypothetical protein
VLRFSGCHELKGGRFSPQFEINIPSAIKRYRYAEVFNIEVFRFF